MGNDLVPPGGEVDFAAAEGKFFLTRPPGSGIFASIFVRPLEAGNAVFTESNGFREAGHGQ
jgi:hypothetical protein